VSLLYHISVSFSTDLAFFASSGPNFWVFVGVLTILEKYDIISVSEGYKATPFRFIRTELYALRPISPRRVSRIVAKLLHRKVKCKIWMHLRAGTLPLPTILPFGAFWYSLVCLCCFCWQAILCAPRFRFFANA